MKTIKNTKIIGIDHGYGNMKTANHCFKTGMCEEKANQKETIKVSAERLRAVLPKGMDSQKTEDFIIRACEHYRKYLIRQRNRDER